MYIHTNVEVSQRHIVKSSKMAISINELMSQNVCFFLFCFVFFFSFFFFLGGGMDGWIIFYFNFYANYVFLLGCLHSVK